MSKEENIDLKKLRIDIQQKWRAYLKENKMDSDKFTGLNGKEYRKVVYGFGREYWVDENGNI